MRIKVMATRLGYYGNRRRREGDVFELIDLTGKDAEGNSIKISAEKQFSSSWMKKVEKPSHHEEHDIVESEDEEQEVTSVRQKPSRQSKPRVQTLIDSNSISDSDVI